MSSRNPVSRDPFEMKARYAGTCAETGKPIAKGDTCIYYPSSRQIFHPESKTAKDFYTWQADKTLGYDY